MKWILIGLLLGSSVTSIHETREACLGRKAVLAEKGVESLDCHELKPGGLTSWTIRPDDSIRVVPFNVEP